MNGINTGKVVIGSAYIGKKREIRPEDAALQRIILEQMPGNATNRAAVVSLSPEACHHIPKAEKTQPRAFKRFRDFFSKMLGPKK